MDPLLVPFGNLRDRSRFDRFSDINLPFHGAVELCGIGGAQGIGGEIADRPLRPVNVLQNALPVVFHAQSQILSVFFVPKDARLACGNSVFDDFPFDFIANENVQRIRQLVCLGADKSRAYLVDVGVKVVRRHTFQLLGEDFLQSGEMRLDEGIAPPDHIFQKAGLALVHCHRRAAPGGSIVKFGRNLHFVNAVSHFVDCGKDETREMILVIMYGNPHVPSSEVRRKRMFALSHHRPRRIEPHHAAQIFHVLFLSVDRILLFREFAGIRQFFLTDFCNQGNEPFLDFGKKAVTFRLIHARLVFVQEDVVSLSLLCFQPFRLFPEKIENRVEIRFKGIEIPFRFAFDVLGVKPCKKRAIGNVVFLGYFFEIGNHPVFYRDLVF